MSRHVTATITLDVSGFQQAMDRLKRAAENAGNALRQMVEQLAIARHGRYNAGPEGWQTDMCAGWLHGSCPAPTLCDCTCHGGTLR